MLILSEKEKQKKYHETKILLIDSNNIERNNIASRFRMMGISVDTMDNGFQAISHIEQVQYDIIIILRGLYDMIAMEMITLIKSSLSDDFDSSIKQDVEPVELLEAQSIKTVSKPANPTKIKKLNPKVICCIDNFTDDYVDEIAMAGADCLYKSRYNFNEVLKSVNKTLLLS